MKKYDLVIFGLTFFAAGVASSYKGETLIVESKTKPGYEFIDCLHPGENYDAPVFTEKGKEFKAFISEQGLLQSKYIFKWTPYFSKWIVEKGITPLLLTNILGVKRECDGYIITLFNAHGKTEIFTKNIIDTRTEAYAYKTYNFVTKGGLMDERINGSRCIAEGIECSVWETPVSNNTDYPTARKEVFSLFDGKNAPFGDYKLVFVADEFYKKADTEECVSRAGYIKKFSSFYDNPIVAFDKGAEFGDDFNDKTYRKDK